MIVSLLLAAQTVAVEPSASKVARTDAEQCVFERVKEATAATGLLADVDDQLEVAEAAIGHCKAKIRYWAEVSPAVRQHGENVEQVELAMMNVLIARGALFAAGEAEPVLPPQVRVEADQE